jgi:hypothetical protein
MKGMRLFLGEVPFITPNFSLSGYLQSPQDNPGGGIDFTALILLNNLSPFLMDFGSVVFSLAYKNVSLSIGTGIATKSPPSNNMVTLKGTRLQFARLKTQDAV